MKTWAFRTLSLLPLALIGCEKSELSFHAPGVSISSVGTHFQASGDLSKMDLAVHPTGPVTQESRTVPEYHAIDADSIVTVQYVKADSPSVEVSARNDVLSQVKTTVTDGTLHLGLEGNFNDPGPVTIKVSGPDLTAISASGASHIDCTGDFSGDLTLSIDGSSSVDLHGSSPKLDLAISGSSSLNATTLASTEVTGSLDGNSQAKLAGKLTDLNVSVAGSANLHADGIEAQNCEFKIDGGSVVEAQGKTDQLNVTASGAATANLPSLVSQNCEAEADGGSQVHVNAVDSLKAIASGASAIGYTGKPTTLVPETDGGASIKGDN